MGYSLGLLMTRFWKRLWLAPVPLLAVAFLSAPAHGSTIQPLPPGPLPTTPPAYLQPPPGGFLNAGILRQPGSTLQLKESLINPDVSFGYQFGTSASSNPYVYLDFFGSGAVTYNYDLSFDVEAVGPTQLYAGQAVKITPYLSHLSSVFLSASQQIAFGTSLNFGLEVGLLGIDVDETLVFPNGEIKIGSGFIEAGGATSLNTSGDNVLVEPSATCPGCFAAETDQGSAPAWRAGIDLLGVAADSVIALKPVDWLFDLDLSLGMPIYRTDVLGLWNYRFDVPSVNICAGITAGSYCDYQITVPFSYSMFASSIFAFGRNLSLDFEGPLGWDENIFSTALGDPFGVGRVNSFYYDLTSSFTLSGRTLVVDTPEGCRVQGNRVICYEEIPLGLQPLGLGSFTDPALLGPQVPADFGGNGKELAYPVPEPGTFALLWAPLLGLGWMRWARVNRMRRRA